VLSGCSPGSESPNQSEADSVLIEPGVRVGKVRGQMSVDDVIAQLGKPDQESGRFLEYRQLGFAVGYNRERVVRVVKCGGSSDVNDPLAKAFKGRTQEGLGIGSTHADIVKVYGEPSNGAKTIGQGGEMLEFKAIGITFTLKDDQVYNISIDFRAGK
ncbi:hypothetical protein N8611_02540, partial [bacterium]|nr:hypothetical protein [bacterium]